MFCKAPKRMLRVVTYACAGVMALGLGGCSLFTPTLDEAATSARTPRQAIDDSLLVQAGTLTVALDTTDAPQAMEATDGTLQGYAIDVAQALAERLGLKLAVVSAGAPGTVLDAGEADIYLGAKTDADSDDYSVVGSYLQNATAVFGGADAPASVSASDLEQAVLGVQEGSASREAIDRLFPNAQVQTFNNVNECVDALAAGDVDYIACDATAGAYLMRAHGNCTFCGVISEVTDWGVAVASGALDLADAVEAELAEMAGDGVLGALHTMWYGALPSSLEDMAVQGVDVNASEDDLLSDEDEDATDGDADGNSSADDQIPDEGGVASAGDMSTWDDEA